jgi:VWFA-related protein
VKPRQAGRLNAVACAAVLAVIAATGASVRGQDQPPVFRTATWLVEVPVIVRDGKGAFVPGLTIEDFEIAEDGRPQTIQALYVAAGPRPGASGGAASAVRQPGELRAADRTFLFLFDMGHLSPGSLTRARDALTQFATARLLASDLSGMAAVGGTTLVQIGPDHAALVEEVQRLRPRGDAVARDREFKTWPRLMAALEAAQVARGDARALEAAIERNCLERDMDCTPMPRGSLETEANRSLVEGQLRAKAHDYIHESRAAARTSLAVLDQASRALSQLPGRKTVIWFTEGSGSDEAAEHARTVVSRAAEAGVVVYAVDPRGLSAKLGDLHDVEISELGWEAVRGMTADLPNFMAAGTGGLYIRNENRMDRVLQRIEEDTSTYYVLGYAAEPDGAGGEFRRIRVRVKRPGLNVRARHGYAAPRASMVAGAVRRPSALEAGRGMPAPLAMLPSRPRLPGGLQRHAVFPETTPAERPPAEGHPGAGAEVPAAERPFMGRLTGAGTTETTTMRLRPDAARQVEALAGGVMGPGAAHAAIGWRAYERGDLEAALEPLAKASETADARPWVLYALGMTQAGLGRLDEALASWERVRAGAPAFEAVYLDLAATYVHLSDLTRALDVLRDAERRWPASADVHNGLGVIHVRRGALDEAIEAFTRAAASAPADSLAQFNLARAYDLRYARSQRYVSSQRRWTTTGGDRRKAIEHYETYLQMGGPHAAEVRNALLRLGWSK